MFEISHDPFRRSDQALHEVSRLFQQCLFAAGAVGRAQFGLEVPVKVFVGIDLGRVRREIEDFDLIFPFGQPGSDELGMMHFQVVEDQKHFLAAVGDQPFHEADEQVGVHGFFDELETHQPLVADGGNHRQAMPLARGRQDRRLSGRRIAAQPMPIFRDRRLVTPVNDRAFGLGPGGNRRIGVIQPLLDLHRVLFQRPLHRPLRGVAPAQQVFAHGAYRHLDVEQGLDQLHHRPTVPQGKGQAQLLGILANDDRAQLPFLGQRQRPARQVATTTGLRLQAARAFH